MGEMAEYSRIRTAIVILQKLALLTSLSVTALAWPQNSARMNEEWTRSFAPFHIVGNIYWVGSYDLACYLITTPRGNIIINTGVGDTAQQIKNSIQQLGFNFGETKIITATHGHFDHASGTAELKRMTGAKLIVPERDRDLFETGGRADFRFGGTPGAHFEPVKVDGTFKDRETISLGGTKLVAHLHPGHTKGSTSFTTNVREGGRTQRVIIANMGSINPGVRVSGMPNYPEITQDYARTFAAQKNMKIDVWLASHASQFRMHTKYKPGDPYSPDRFVDRQGFLASVQQLERTYLDQLARERSGN
jgi:metallo-beta-lactamase class B